LNAQIIQQLGCLYFVAPTHPPNQLLAAPPRKMLETRTDTKGGLGQAQQYFPFVKSTAPSAAPDAGRPVLNFASLVDGPFLYIKPIVYVYACMFSRG